MPELYADLADYVGAFHVLSAGRPSGFSGAEPIPLIEILAYQRAFMPDEELDRFLYLIRRADRAYLEAIATKQRQQSKSHAR